MDTNTADNQNNKGVEGKTSQQYNSSQEKVPRHEITIAIVSDIHCAFEKLEKLKNWHSTRNIDKIDYVLGLGDFDNLDNNDPNLQKASASELESMITKQLQCLEFFSVPIIYIPGNHDTTSIFTKKPSLTEKSTNIHGGVYHLAEGLNLVGFGGSLPGYKKGQQVWDGFPYTSDEELRTKFQEEVQKHLDQPNVQNILVTHVGPYNSSTTKDMEGEVIDSGSQYLEEVLIKESNNIFLNLHGHTHSGAGRSNYTSERKQVINPGSLSEGNFGILKLARNSWTQKWSVKSFEFLCLSSMF